MGQKTNPIGLRLGINRNWRSRWFINYNTMPENVLGDYELRKFLKKKLYYAGISDIIIERTAKKIRITIFAAKPGIIIGKGGSEIEALKKELQNKIGDKELILNIKEERKPQISAQLAAENIATQIERRVAFRRAMKKAIQNALKSGAKGIKVQVAGRLNGAEMARTEWYLEGRVPLHTLRAKIDYGFAEALTTYGIIGVKVWIFKGEVLQRKNQEAASIEERKPQRRRKGRRHVNAKKN
ncbi:MULTISPECIES: 30S ribosomal protein S3 [unclassified Lebetimonas]|uniref:30S ribosomal protein S3 n=1 Tax=unclassified Lebetimonas TaxID=2648158 RepID=UPI000466B276|nr:MULTISPECIES: 30S ribosomal protein S3 [unclassified Lebetimonas]